MFGQFVSMRSKERRGKRPNLNELESWDLQSLQLYLVTYTLLRESGDNINGNTTVEVNQEIHWRTTFTTLERITKMRKKKIGVVSVWGEEWTAGLSCREFWCWCAHCTRTRNFRTVEPLLEPNLARFSKQKSGVWKSGWRAAGERRESGRWQMKKDDDDGKAEDDEWRW